MTDIEFKDYLGKTFEELESLLQSKGDEYTLTDSNILHNFDKASVIQNQPREQIILNFSMKHFVSILDMVENIVTDVPSDSLITEKFNDMIAYLIIMKASLLQKNSL